MKTTTLLILLLTTCMLPAALLADAPLPTDPRVVAGDIIVSSPAANQLQVQQGSVAGIVDWGSFSIGSGYGVQFNNGNGATLNRVTGNDLSTIFGTLQATGSVYLINQNGIVFGASGVVETGGSFVASTLDITDRDFLAGGDDVFAGGSDAYVINLGRISSLGGDVALLGRNVVNEGTIAAPDGTVGLVAGREILMRDTSVADGMFSVLVGGADTGVTDSGAIRAAAAELRANGGNVYALAGNTSSTIVATGVAKVRGRVFLTAGDRGTVRVTKAVKAAAVDGKGGQITVNGGTVAMAGLLDVTGRSGGEVRLTAAVETVFSGDILAFGTGPVATGGFVEVSGRHLTFDGTVNTGGGTVLIDPDNIEITDGSALLSGASVLTTTEITMLLSTGDLIIQTSDSAREAGTIAVTSALNVASPFVLTLLAHGDIMANASIQVGDTAGGGLNLVAGWDGSTSTTAFDAGVFNAADLASQSVFGNATGTLYLYDGARYFASGSVFIGDGSQFGGVAVGSFSGDTNVYAGDIVLTGSSNSDNFYGFAQLGYNASGFGAGSALDSAITVRATGDISLNGGAAGNSAAQIGNIGLNAAETSIASLVSSSAAITIDALGDLSLTGGSGGGFAYAMVGNGSFDQFSSSQTLGDRSGAITVGALGEISVEPAGSGQSAGWIGHATAFGTVSNADIVLTAAAFDTDAGASVGVGGIGQLDIAVVAANLLGGNFTATATSSGLTLFGTTAQSSCECGSITTASDLVVQAANGIVLDTSFAFSNTGGGDVALAAGGNFTNNSGADAFGTLKGRWLIYSTRPDANLGDIGVLGAQFLRYDTTFDSSAPFALDDAGNGLIYTVQPVVEVADASVTYGGTLTLPTPQMMVDGIVVEAVDFGLSMDGSFVDLTKVAVSDAGFVNAGVYATALDATVSIVPATVRRVVGVVTDFGQLTVDQAVLTGVITGRPTRVYNGTTTATLTAADFLLSGFVSGEGATVVQTAGTYASANANAFGPIAVSASLGAGDLVADTGTLLANYVLPITVAGNGVIGQAVITGSILGMPTKVYDGSTLATLTPANVALTGFVAGEGATVTQIAGTYVSANASGTNTVTATLTASDFAATAGTLMANYVLPATVTGNGVIDRARLYVTIVGVPSKPFDGTNGATLTAANFLLAGFVAGEGATITQTRGTFATTGDGTGTTVTADLATSDYAANTGTRLANYILPDTASGADVIDTAPPPQPAIPQTRGLETFVTTPLGEPAGPATGLELISAETTQRIMAEINAGSAFCKALVNQEFVIDCLSDRLQAVADGLSSVGEYAEVRAALEDAAQQLHALALANASSELARTVARVSGLRSSRALTAISTAAMGAANAQAAAIIDGAQLVLLRSSSGSEQRSVAFTQVAQVVNSTKVLLRSS